jgi:hypothetical protein
MAKTTASTDEIRANRAGFLDGGERRTGPHSSTDSVGAHAGRG